MGKLAVKNLIKSLIFVFISITVPVAIIALISLIVHMFTALIYVISGLIGLAVCFIQRKFYFVSKRYYYPEEINDIGSNIKKNTYWIERIREGKFIKRAAAQSIYIPYFILGVATIVFIALFHSVLQNGGNNIGFVGYAAICAALSALAVSLFLYGIFGLCSLRACKECGAVNAFVYDESLENVTATAYGSVLSYGSVRTKADTTTLFYKGGAVTFNKGDNYGYRVECHCACCGKKEIVTESWSEKRYA